MNYIWNHLMTYIYIYIYRYLPWPSFKKVSYNSFKSGRSQQYIIAGSCQRKWNFTQPARYCEIKPGYGCETTNRQFSKVSKWASLFSEFTEQKLCEIIQYPLENICKNFEGLISVKILIDSNAITSWLVYFSFCLI